MKKRILSLILVLVMAIGFLPTMAFAGGVDYEIVIYSSGDFDYTVYEGKAKINYTGTDTNVTIPSTIDGYAVTSIRWNAFFNNENLTTIVIPNSVTEINYSAFAGCKNLKTVYYTGSKAQRNNIVIDGDNEPLTNATWHYNYVPECKIHKYSNNADTSCNVCGKFAYPGGNTLYKVGTKYYHIVNRKIVKDTTLVLYGGKYLYVKNGVYTKATTLVNYGGKILYVKNGAYTKATTLVNYGGKMLYVKNGAYTKATTLVKYNGKLLYVKNGAYTKATTLVKYGNRYYYVRNGVMNPNLSGKVKIGKKIYTVRNGIIV